MLKAHQACIDLEKNVLRIQGREVRFLSEHELPEKARDPVHLDPATEGPVPPVPSAPGPASTTSSSPFPGGGRTIGQAPTAGGRPGAPPRAPSSSHPEASIQILMDLGATRELAISTLDASGGNVDVAASLLF
jgi:DNA damage-inducible protein 1